jgi:hypothetical protein
LLLAHIIVQYWGFHSVYAYFDHIHPV